MKHIVILGDGMADHPVERLHQQTPLQYANTPFMDLLAANGRTGRLVTVPEGFAPGSEVANTAILGYDLPVVYEGRGPLEAASIGYEMRREDLALRCNLISLDGDMIKNHHGGHLDTDNGSMLIQYLNDELSSDTIQFIPGIQYRHLLIIRGGSKHIVFYPPHDYPGRQWRPLMCHPEPGWEDYVEPGRMSAGQTAQIINRLILESQRLLARHPYVIYKHQNGADTVDTIWPWGGGYRPNMLPLSAKYPSIHSGSVISAVDLIRGIGHYAGLKIIKVEGATGLYDTNYEGKVAAAIKALRHDDFVFLHIEASDEAGHDGDLDLKVRTIENLDSRVVGPIYREVSDWDCDVCISVLPDHPTPVEIRTHVNEPVPFLIWHRGITPDDVKVYNEASVTKGAYPLIRLNEYMQLLMSF